MKKQKLNNDGAVLFTVICLMSILTVVLMTAIIVVSSSHKKAITNYTESQSYVTAKSTVDVFMECLEDTDTYYDPLRTELKGISDGDTKEIDVTMPNGNPEKLLVKKDGDIFTITSSITEFKSESSVSCKVRYVPAASYSSDLNTVGTNISNILPQNNVESKFDPDTSWYIPRGGSENGPFPVKLASTGTNLDTKWTDALRTGLNNNGISGQARINIDNAKFLWEDTRGGNGWWWQGGHRQYPDSNHSFSQETHDGDLVKFEYNFYIPSSISTSDLKCYCAADDAYIVFINDNFIGSNNFLRLNADGTYNNCNVPGFLPTSFRNGSSNGKVIEQNERDVLAIVGDGNPSSDRFIEYDLGAIGNGAKILNIDHNYLNYDNINNITIYAYNGYSDDPLLRKYNDGGNPAFVSYAFLLHDDLLGDYSSTSPESWVFEKYIN